MKLVPIIIVPEGCTIRVAGTAEEMTIDVDRPSGGTVPARIVYVIADAAGKFVAGIGNVEEEDDYGAATLLLTNTPPLEELIVYRTKGEPE